MASNFSRLNIETIDGKIQNVSSLCDYIKSTVILEDDVGLLESLANKLANDNNRDNLYINEEPIVDVLHARLLGYYIDTYKFDMYQILDTIEVFNKKVKDIKRIKYNNLLYIVIDNKDDIDVICIKDETAFIELVKNNLDTLVKGNISDVYELLKNNLFNVSFSESNDEEISTYRDTFNIDNKIYYGKDIKNNQLYKIKNSLLVKGKDGINVLLQPTFEELDNNHKVISAKEKYQSFDLEDFKHLSNRVLNQVEMTDDEVARFYYEVRFLINTMVKRDEHDEKELREALDTYMEPLVNIFNTSKDVLSENDQRNVIDYLGNKKKIRHKIHN